MSKVTQNGGERQPTLRIYIAQHCPTCRDALQIVDGIQRRFAAVDVLDGLWNYLAGQIMPAAAGLAVVAAIINFATHRPAMRLIAAALGFLTVSALWRLVQHMM